MENSMDYAITHAHAWLPLRTLWFQDLRISSLTIPFVSAFFTVYLSACAVFLYCFVLVTP